MNENINLVEILKDCPIGTKLYSSIVGDCELKEVKQINTSASFNINVRAKDADWWFTSKGTYLTDGFGECTLFPSKENRDWSTFKAPKKEYNLKPFDKVLVRDAEDGIWCADFYSHLKENNKHVTIGDICKYCIPYEGNEHLVGTNNPY